LTHFQIPWNDIQILRNKIQAGRNKFQFRRNEIQIQNPSISFAESSLIKGLADLQVTGADFGAEEIVNEGLIQAWDVSRLDRFA